MIEIGAGECIRVGVVGEQLLVVLREPVLLAGLVHLLSKVGGARRSFGACSLEHGREIAIAVVKRVLVRVLVGCWGCWNGGSTLLDWRRCFVGEVSNNGVGRRTLVRDRRGAALLVDVVEQKVFQRLRGDVVISSVLGRGFSAVAR